MKDFNEVKADLKFSVEMFRGGKVFDLAINYNWMVGFSRPENDRDWSDITDPRLVIYRQGILDCQEIIQKSGFAVRNDGDAMAFTSTYDGGIVDLAAGCEKISADIKKFLLGNGVSEGSDLEHAENVLKSSYRLSIKDAYEAIFNAFNDEPAIKNFVRKAPDIF